MGSRIVMRLIDAGNELYGTNRTAAKGGPLIERGMKWPDTAREVAAAAHISFSTVTDDDTLQAIAELRPFRCISADAARRGARLRGGAVAMGGSSWPRGRSPS